MRNKTTSTPKKSKTSKPKPTPNPQNPILRHWRLLIPIFLMVAIFLLSAPPRPSLSSWTDSFSLLNLRVFIFALLGASWYYYLRVLGRFTPAFTVLASLLFSGTFAFLNELPHFFSHAHSSFTIDIFVESAIALLGIIIFAALYYATRTKSQKLARTKQVEQLWKDNDRLAKKLHPSTKK